MNLSYRAGWLSFRLVFRLCFRARYFNPERVPNSGPVILASNHASYLDPPLVGCGLARDISYLARDSLFRFPVFGTILQSWNAVPVDREGGGPAGLRTILERLRNGGGIILFPEGTRSPDGQLRAARSGIGLVVIKSKAPLVPVRVFGTERALGRRHRFPRPFSVAVKYGQPLSFEHWRAAAQQASKGAVKEIYERVAAEVMAAIAQLQPWRDRDSFP